MPRPQRMLRTVDRKWREAKMVARGFHSASHPILAQIVPIRRCNLACTYCNEYDKHSLPVALATLRERINHLARLRTANIELSGGEPLLHPDLDDLIRHIREAGALPGTVRLAAAGAGVRRRAKPQSAAGRDRAGRRAP